MVQATLDGILIGILFALIAYGMALQWGVMNIINIAQGDLVILGGYIAYTMYLAGIHPAWGVIVSPIIMFFVGWGLYKLVINKVVDRDLFISILATFGGFEIVMMVGAMLESAVLGRILLIDGFIATSALLAASKISPKVSGYAVYSHRSDELGHEEMLKYLQADPIVSLRMCLGEGTGSAVVFPILRSAVAFLDEMASFESAHISGKNG